MTSRSNVSGRCEMPPAARTWIGLSEQISICSRLLRCWIAQHSEPAGIQEAELSLLWACAAAPVGGFSQKQLANALAISPAHVSGLVEQMRRKGLLHGRRATDDRRRRQWQLTPQGRTELMVMLGRLNQWAGELNRHVPDLPDQLTELVDQLTSVLTSRSPRGNSLSTAEDDCEPDTSAHQPQKRGAA